MIFRTIIRLFTLLLVASAFVSSLVAQTSSTASVNGNVSQIVNPYPTQLSLAPSSTTAASGDQITFTATLTRTSTSTAVGPTGQVAFTLSPQDGQPTTYLAQIQNDSVSWTYAPPSGVNTIIASYPGDQNYAATSAQTTVTISAPTTPDFDFTLPSVTIKSGQSFNGNIAVQALNGFSGNVTFTAGSLPDGVTLTIPSSSINFAQSSPSPSSAQTVQFELSTEATTVTTVSGLILLGGIGFRRRRRKAFVALLALAGVSFLALAGCGAGNRYLQTNGTPPGTYTIPITGTSGGLTHMHNLTLIVQSN